MKRILLLSIVTTIMVGFLATPAEAAKEEKKKKRKELAQAAASPLAKYDANGDGTIDKDEVAELEKIAELFKKCDKNANGKIDEDEVSAVQEAFKASATPVKRKKKNV